MFQHSIKNSIRYIKIPSNLHIRNTGREWFLIPLVTGKKIFHIGPCDAPYTKEKFAKNELLYQKFDAVVEKQIGIDVDAESVAFLNEKSFQKSHIDLLNMNSENTTLYSWFDADYIIMGEVIEHLMNLENALQGMKQYMHHENTRLVITTPNAARLDIFLSNFMNISSEHSDHKVAFQLVNLFQILEANGFEIEQYNTVWYAIWIFQSEKKTVAFLRKILSFLNLCLTKKFPLFWSTHIVICKIKK